MKAILFLVLNLAILSAQADNVKKLPPVGMSAPGYQSLAKIDAAVTALSLGGHGTGLARRPVSDVTLHSATMLSDGRGHSTIEVDVGNSVCPVEIESHQPPKGIIGNPTYSGLVKSCRSYTTVKAVDVLKYEVVRTSLAAAAQHGKVDLSFEVKGVEITLTKEK